jgi:hypothetical protein
MLYFIAARAGLQCLTVRLEGGQQEDQMSLEKLLNLQITTASWTFSFPEASPTGFMKKKNSAP